MVLWDNFESYTHPQLLSFVIDWLLNKDWQIILSTHSIDVLYELFMNENVKENEIPIIKLQRNEENVFKSSILDFKTLEKHFEGGLDARKIFD